MPHEKTTARREDRIDVRHEYELCAWARHFNASEQRVREAVATVGEGADKVREHLSQKGASPGVRHSGDRPSRLA